MQKAQRKSNDALRNPDDLERFIKVTSPAVWAVLAACIVVLGALFAWGVFGSVTTEVTTRGAVANGRGLCYLPAGEAAKVHVGDEVDFDGQRVEVAEVDAVPTPVEEARIELGSDYLADALFVGDWGYRLTFNGDVSALEQGVPLEVSITVERVAPITLILRDRG